MSLSVNDESIHRSVLRQREKQTIGLLSVNDQVKVRTGSSRMMVVRMTLVSITSSLVLFSFFYRSPVKVIEMGDIRVPTIKPLGCVRTKEILEGKNQIRWTISF